MARIESIPLFSFKSDEDVINYLKYLVANDLDYHFDDDTDDVFCSMNDELRLALGTNHDQMLRFTKNIWVWFDKNPKVLNFYLHWEAIPETTIRDLIGTYVPEMYRPFFENEGSTEWWGWDASLDNDGSVGSMTKRLLEAGRTLSDLMCDVEWHHAKHWKQISDQCLVYAYG